MWYRAAEFDTGLSLIKIKEIVGTVEVCAFLCAILILLVSSSVNAVQKCTEILKHTYHNIVLQYSTYKSVLGSFHHCLKQWLVCQCGYVFGGKNPLHKEICHCCGLNNIIINCY